MKLEQEVARGEKMLANEGFLAKAPQSKIEEERGKLENYNKALKATQERLEKLKK